MFIKKNSDGNIIAMSEEPLDGFEPVSDEDGTRVGDFIEKSISSSGENFLSHDLAFVRVIEDLIELLMEKGVIQITELPDASQSKMLARQRLRNRLSNSLNLIDDSDFMP